MALGRVHWPRLALTPLLLGLLLGLAGGRWYFQRHADQPNHLASRGNEAKLTCLVIVKSKTFRNVNASKFTWLRKCDHYLIVQPNKTKKSLSSFASPNQDSCQHPADVLAIAAGSSWGVLCQALHVLPTPLHWLLIVPDSLLVVVENVRRLVRGRDWKLGAYLGHPVRHYSGDWNVLSAGVLLSNGSVSRLLAHFPDKTACERGGKYWNNEDLYLGTHLRELGVRVEDTRDELGRTRFHGFNVNALLSPGSLFRQTDYYKKALFPSREGLDCCARDLVTVDTSDADHAYLHYFLMYGVGRQGIAHPAQSTAPSHSEPPWVTALRDIGYKGPTDNMSSQQYYDIWAKHIPPELLFKKLAESVAP